MTRTATYELGSIRQASAGVQPGIKPAIRYAFCLFMFSLLFETLDLSVPVKVTAITGAAFLLSTLSQPRLCYRQPPAVVWCFAAWVCVCLVMAVWVGTHWDDVAHEIFVLAQSVLLLWVAYSVMLDPKVARSAMISLVASCVLLAILQLTGVTATVIDAGTAEARVTAVGQNPSDIAMISSIALLYVANAVLGRRGCGTWTRISSIAVMGLLGLTVLHTEARGAIIALAAGLLVFLFQPGGIGVRGRNLVLILLAVFAFVLVGLRSKSMVDRFNQAQSGHMAGREKIYPLAIGLVKDRPFLGWGFVTNTYELGSRVNHPGMPRRDPHNLPLFLLTATGFIGAAPAFAGLWISLRLAWRARTSAYGILPFAMLVTLLVGNLSITWYSKLFWILLAFASAAWMSQSHEVTARSPLADGFV